IREVEEDTTTSPNHRLAHRLLALALVGHTWPEVPQPFAWPTVARPLGRYWPGQQAAAKLQSWSLSFHSRHSFNPIYVMQPHTYLRFFCAGVFVFLRCLLVGERRQPIHEFTRGCSKCEQVKATEVQSVAARCAETISRGSRTTAARFRATIHAANPLS